MAKRLALDRILFVTILLLVTYGAVMVYSSSAVLSMDFWSNSYTFALKHFVFVFLGFFLMVIMSEYDYKKLASISLLILLMLITLTMLVYVLFMSPINGTYRWIRLGMFSFQPSELAKIVLLLFLAAYLYKHIDKIRSSPAMIFPALLIIGIYTALIIVEPDLGTGIIIIFTVLIVIFMVTIPLRYYLISAIGVSSIIYYLIISSNYRIARVLAFINPWADPLGYGFQPIQSMIAIGSGGLVGVGLTKSTQKYFYLPAPHTDFIYSVISEELGFIGTILLLMLFAVLFWRGLRIALKAPDKFGSILALGITVFIVGQALFNISVALTLIPTKGIPLPLISYGGTSMLINMISLGILLNISRYTT